jgi:lysophospholipase L1-like esterase
MNKHPRNIVFIGDSLTEYCNWQERFPEDSVTNLGVSGETAGGLLRRLKSGRTRLNDPDFIFVMTGINDVAVGDCDILEDYREILEEMHSQCPATVIVAESLLPVLLPWTDNASIGELNRSLERMARECGAFWLDIYSLFTDSDGSPLADCLSEDGVHLSGEGYRVWTEALKDFLRTRA